MRCQLPSPGALFFCRRRKILQGREEGEEATEETEEETTERGRVGGR